MELHDFVCPICTPQLSLAFAPPPLLLYHRVSLSRHSFLQFFLCRLTPSPPPSHDQQTKNRRISPPLPPFGRYSYHQVGDLQFLNFPLTRSEKCFQPPPPLFNTHMKGEEREKKKKNASESEWKKEGEFLRVVLNKRATDLTKKKKKKGLFKKEDEERKMRVASRFGLG